MLLFGERFFGLEVLYVDIDYVEQDGLCIGIHLLYVVDAFHGFLFVGCVLPKAGARVSRVRDEYNCSKAWQKCRALLFL